MCKCMRAFVCAVLSFCIGGVAPSQTSRAPLNHRGDIVKVGDTHLQPKYLDQGQLDARGPSDVAVSVCFCLCSKKYWENSSHSGAVLGFCCLWCLFLAQERKPLCLPFRCTCTQAFLFVWESGKLCREEEKGDPRVAGVVGRRLSVWMPGV